MCTRACVGCVFVRNSEYEYYVTLHASVCVCKCVRMRFLSIGFVIKVCVSVIGKLLYIFSV